MEKKIELDKATLKALSADTRIDILKTLNKRRHTQSELSAVLDLSIPTVKEHLAAMEKAGLVQRHEEGRKWKYYSLTDKGKCILDPERKRIWIVLAMFGISVAGGVIAMLSNTLFAPQKMGKALTQTIPAALDEAAEGALRKTAEAVAAAPAPEEAAAETMTAGAQFAADTASSSLNYLAMIFFILAVFFIIILMYFIIKNRRMRNRILRRKPKQKK